MAKKKKGVVDNAPQLSRDTMMQVIESLRDGVYVVNENYDIEYVSPVLEREYGEWRGLKCYQYFEVRAAPCLYCRNDEVFAGNTIRYEWYSELNGKTFELIDTPLSNPDGTRSKLEIFRDITERKKAEKELRSYRDQLEALVEQRTSALQRSNIELRTRTRYLTCLAEISHQLLRSEDPRSILPGIMALLGGVCFASRCYLVESDRTDGTDCTCLRRYEWVSQIDAEHQEADRFTNSTYAELGLGRWAELLSQGDLVLGATADSPPDERSFLESRNVDSVLAVPLIICDEWCGFLAIDSCEGVREWEHEVDFLLIAAGEIAVALENDELAHDIRGYAADLEQRVSQRTAELMAANRELESFAYSVSHDLRAPLRSINGYAGALIEDHSNDLDDDAKEYLRKLMDASRRMGVLIDELLDLSRVARLEMRREDVDLSAVANNVIESLRHAEPEREVEVDIAPGLVARGDPRLLRLVLENLLGNAWKFTAKNVTAHVHFGAHTVDGEPTYFVRDDGAGFDMEYASRVFEPFQRLHSNIDFEGTGVGLATVFRIVQRHGGMVWAESEPGHGATFFFTLG